MDFGLYFGAGANGYGRIAFNRGGNCGDIGTGIALAADHRDQKDRAEAQSGRPAAPGGATLDAG